jgi:tetrachlorobenzoquinone reductase
MTALAASKEKARTAATEGLIEVRLASISYLADQVTLLEFQPLDGQCLPDYASGAHLDLHLPNGMTRQYSLATPFSGESYVIGVKRDPASRGGSTFIHDHLRVGHQLSISSPRNHFPLHSGREHAVLFAGGIGMISELETAGRSWELHYAVRERRDVAFARKLAAAGLRARIYLSGDGPPVLDMSSVIDVAPPGSHFYCCGPEPMLVAFKSACSGIPVANVHFEHFSATVVASQDTGFKIIAKRTGKEVIVPPGGTILEALNAAGVETASSCKQGVCGACETVVIDGTPDHRDVILSDAEKASNKTMMICCSGAKSPSLVLDI